MWRGEREETGPVICGARQPRIHLPNPRGKLPAEQPAPRVAPDSHLAAQPATLPSPTGITRLFFVVLLFLHRIQRALPERAHPADLAPQHCRGHGSSNQHGVTLGTTSGPAAAALSHTRGAKTGDKQYQGAERKR